MGKSRRWGNESVYPVVSKLIVKMGITMMGGLFGNITSDVQNLVPHVSREESRTLHAFKYLVSRIIIEYVT